jgi:Holliday junction resolvasome RuvABC endonuclease subunit
MSTNKGITPKKILAVDPSLTASGWALFDVVSGSPEAVGVISPPGPKFAMSERLLVLQNLVEETISDLGMCRGDVLVCEGPAPLVLNPNSAMKVEQVRGIFEVVARSKDIRVPGRINPRTVQSELLGMRGKQLARREVKEWARATAVQLYGPGLDRLPRFGKAGSRSSNDGSTISQDIIDALLIGALCVSRVQLSQRMGSSLESFFLPSQKRKSSGGRHGGAWSEKDLAAMMVRNK